MQGRRTDVQTGKEKRDPTSTHLTSLLSDFLMAGWGGVWGGVLTSWCSQKGSSCSFSLNLTCMLWQKGGGKRSGRAYFRDSLGQ